MEQDSEEKDKNDQTHWYITKIFGFVSPGLSGDQKKAMLYLKARGDVIE